MEEELEETEEELEEIDGEPSEDGDLEEKPKEPWMEIEDDDGKPPEDPSKTVPVGKFVATKKKLRGQISERDDEIERLQRENESLKPQKPKVLTRPVKGDFNTDEEFETALDGYQDERAQETFNRRSAEEKQRADMVAAQGRFKEAVDAHYERAGQLIESAGIEPDLYKKADRTVREAVEAVVPKMGDARVDQFISVLGEGSEKVMYFVGRNQAALHKFQALLSSDTSGLTASVFLGQEKQRISNPTKPVSQAPVPSSQANGDGVVNLSGEASRKKFNAANKKGIPQDAYNIKKAAKAAGVNVSGW